VTSEDATALLHLRCLWQETYTITLSNGIWAARRHDQPARVLTADTPRTCAGRSAPITANGCGPAR
jgi:hypothetical protein